ncbi:MAG: Uma2 family endonuclease [Tumebacillaceae bacterium]
MRESFLNKTFTYADYLTFPDEPRVEIIDGVIYNMTPAPSTKHQRVLGELFRKFADYLDGKTCEVFFAPFDVRLLSESKQDDEVTNVVQPDLTVVCDKDKLDERGCNGSPDLLVEVLSPGTAKHDKSRKMKLYRRARVREYWIVDPANEIVEVYKFREDGFPDFAVYSKEDVITVGLFEDLEIDLQTVFR